MKALLKQADDQEYPTRHDYHEPGWEDALFDPPVPANAGERKTKGKAELAGTAIGGALGAGVGGAAGYALGGPGGAIGGSTTGTALGGGIGRLAGSVIGSKNLLDERHDKGEPTYYQRENELKVKKSPVKHPGPEDTPLKRLHGIEAKL